MPVYISLPREHAERLLNLIGPHEEQLGSFLFSPIREAIEAFDLTVGPISDEAVVAVVVHAVEAEVVGRIVRHEGGAVREFKASGFELVSRFGGLYIPKKTSDSPPHSEQSMLQRLRDAFVREGWAVSGKGIRTFVRP